MVRCNIAGCEFEPRWQVCMQVWAQGRSKENSGPLLMATGVVVCDHHKANPVSTAAEMFPPEGRERVQAALKAAGKAPANFDSAEFVFAAVTPEQAERLARGHFDEGLPKELEDVAVAHMRQRVERIEDQTIERYWRFFEQIALAPIGGKEPEPALRNMLRDSFQAGASAIAALWQRCEQESDERRRATAQRLVTEADGFARDAVLRTIPAASGRLQ
jgi:hypothetical protein